MYLSLLNINKHIDLKINNIYGKKITILCIDDDDKIRELLEIFTKTTSLFQLQKMRSKEKKFLNYFHLI